MNPSLLVSLRETARLFTTHYSTMIEGNELTTGEIKQFIKLEGHFPGRERDEKEVKGYYAALKQMEKYVVEKKPVTEHIIKTLHALVMSDGRTIIKATSYRDISLYTNITIEKIIILQC